MYIRQYLCFPGAITLWVVRLPDTGVYEETAPSAAVHVVPLSLYSARKEVGPPADPGVSPSV